MFDLSNPSTDTTIPSYSSPYVSTAYRPFTSTPSSTFLFNIPSTIDEQQQQQQRLTDFSSYQNPTHDFM